MLGKVYQMKEGFNKGEKGSIAVVEDILYYRSTSIDPNPVICLSADNLEELPVNYDLNIKEINQSIIKR